MMTFKESALLLHSENITLVMPQVGYNENLIIEVATILQSYLIFLSYTGSCFKSMCLYCMLSYKLSKNNKGKLK